MGKTMVSTGIFSVLVCNCYEDFRGIKRSVDQTNFSVSSALMD